jgi:biopolymer transport protein ExbB/TolQ
VAAGISEALITTVTGLVIAVPSLAIYSYFTTRAAGRAIQFEPYGHGFVDALLRRWQAGRAA